MKKKKIKIIALDMDGVVNSDYLINKWIKEKTIELKDQFNTEEALELSVRKAFFENFKYSTELVFDELASYITKICKETNCYIIWSSTWRKLKEYQDIKDAKKMFDRHNIPGKKLIAYTPQTGMTWGGHCRGTEIKLWIKDNEKYEVEKCAVIDDRVDAGRDLPPCAQFFRIDPYWGITEDDANKIIQFLNED